MTLDEKLWRITVGIPEQLPSTSIKHVLYERWKDSLWLPEDMGVLHYLGINFLSSEEQVTKEIDRRTQLTRTIIKQSTLEKDQLQFLVFQVELDFLNEALTFYKEEEAFAEPTRASIKQALAICTLLLGEKDFKEARATLLKTLLRETH